MRQLLPNSDRWALSAVLLCFCFSSPRLVRAQSRQATQDCSAIEINSCAGLEGQAASDSPATSIPGTDVVSGKVTCNDPRILNDPASDAKRQKSSPGVNRQDYNFIACVAYRLTKGTRISLPTGFGSSWMIAIAHKNEINSVTMPLRDGRLAVVAYDSMARFVNYDPDEEAFILGHEIGHIQDWTNCQNVKTQKVNQALIMKQHALMKGQQACEENADFYGLQYMWGARFNPYAAGALMGRVQMYLPDETRGLSSILNNFTSNHPISSERTKKMRDEMIELCSKPGTVCQMR